MYFDIGERLVSDNRKAALTIKTSGNLVLECMNTERELWSTGTSGKDVRLKIQVVRVGTLLLLSMVPP